MSSTRRSARSKKQVDYSLADNETPENSDDDFQDSPSGPPPNKKLKMSTKIPKIKVTQEEKKPEPKEVPPIRKERLSIEEKKYKRELDIALAESMKDSQSGEETKEIIQLSDDESPQKQKHKVQKNSRLEDLSDVDENKGGTNKENENIESRQGMSHEEVAASINQDKEESKTISSTEQEESKSDNEADNEEENIDDGNEDDDISGEDEDGDDSDFDEKKERNPQNKRKSEQAKSSPSKVGIKPRISVTVTPLKMLKSQARRMKQGSPKGSSKSVSSVDSSSATNSPQTSVSKPVLSNNLLTSSNIHRSPAMGSSGVKIRSTPTLRLGLSRNVRVKPLLSKISTLH